MEISLFETLFFEKKEHKKLEKRFFDFFLRISKDGSFFPLREKKGLKMSQKILKNIFIPD